MSVHPQVLKLDIAGCPVEWIRWEAAATLYARECVRWEAGETRFTVFGGMRPDGSRSTLSISSIIAVQDRGSRYQRRRPPPVTSHTVYQRDRNLCMYCGQKFPAHLLSLDHVVPKSRGGAFTFSNLVTACRACNQKKDDRTPEEAGMRLLAVPYTPDPAAFLLLLAAGRITACQQSFLEQMARKGQRLA